MSAVDYRAVITAAIKSGKAVPPLSAAVRRLNELFADPTATARILGKVIETDANMSARILRQVNSPFYGLTYPIKTVTQAVVILGFGEIKYLANNAALRELFKMKKKNSDGIDPHEIWDGTLQIACLAQTIAEQCGYPFPPQIFTSVILGKTGALALNNLFGKTYANIAEPLFFAEDLPIAEFHQFALNHVHLGLVFAKLWKLPIELQNAVAYQYNPMPGNLPLQVEAAFIYIARRLFYARKNRIADAEIIADFPAMIRGNFPLTEATIIDARQFAEERYAEAKQALGK